MNYAANILESYQASTIIPFPTEPPPLPPVPAELLSAMVIGYGNTLRSDDGVGRIIASRLSDSIVTPSTRRLTRCRFLSVHQLLPELTEELRRARRAIFIDASLELRPGQVRIHRIPPDPVLDLSLLAHHVSPGSLLALTRYLYGAAPRAWMVAVGPANLAPGDRLSPPVCLAVARLSHLLAHRLAHWAASYP